MSNFLGEDGGTLFDYSYQLCCVFPLRAEEIPSDVLRQRELKWLEMLKSWDKWMAKKHKKVKERCQKGIPPSLRGRAWLYLTGGKAKKEQNRSKFEELKNHPGDPKWLDVIERDLHRQFPFHEMFASKGGLGQQDLLDVLKAYTVYRSEEGYCQAQAPIAALLLMHMPAEDAFWTLVQICEKYIPGYYSTGLEAIQLDGEILFSMLRRVSPVAHRHLKKQNVEPVLYMTEWFMCAFCRTLPWASVLRVWDMFLCEGVKILFKVGLVLLKYSLGTQEKLKGCHGLYETMELLRSINPQYTHEAFLVHEVRLQSVLSYSYSPNLLTFWILNPFLDCGSHSLSGVSDNGAKDLRKRHREGAPNSAASLEGVSRRSPLQVPSKDARC
uniref:TBC1 domain family member 10A n=1 Tax=Nothobranchius furzeri TaxID=105023 RepID=A0A8C6P4H6_NOTFU